MFLSDSAGGILLDISILISVNFAAWQAELVERLVSAMQAAAPAADGAHFFTRFQRSLYYTCQWKHSQALWHCIVVAAEAVGF